MSTVKIILADDIEDIHSAIRKTLEGSNFEFNIIEDFYDTVSLLDYFQHPEEHELEPDVLLLDNNFNGNGKNGIEVIPDIRACCPWLPIIMLTAEEDDNIFDEAREKHNVDYINKPAKASDLRFRIKNIMGSMDNLMKLQKEITENQEFIDWLSNENDRLSSELDIEQNSAVAYSLPVNMQELIQRVFPDIEFISKSFRLLVKASVQQADWIRMFRSLKMIDWKDTKNIPNGVKVQPYREGKKYGYNDVWEYRFSKAGRIFVERRKERLPLILLIDPNHSYDKLPSL